MTFLLTVYHENKTVSYRNIVVFFSVKFTDKIMARIMQTTRTSFLTSHDKIEKKNYWKHPLVHLYSHDITDVAVK